MDATEDTRNVVDKYKNWQVEDIIRDLDAKTSDLEVAVENLTRDYNMGTIVRSANAFGVRHLHIIGRRQWNKRGAMMTDKYLHVHYYDTAEAFTKAMLAKGKTLYAIDNLPGALPIEKTPLSKVAVLVFGSESDGLSEDMTKNCHQTLEISQSGSTRSLNVGVAAGIAMYEWSRQHRQTS